jgi:hypothetical protein
MSLKFIFLLFWAVPSQATELFEYNQSVRQLGMGGVYAFNENDASSMLNNPGYLCFTEGMNWTVFNLGGGINGLQIFNDISSIGTISGIGSLTPLYGKNIWAGGSGHSTLTFPCFGFSAYGSGSVALQLYNPPAPNMDVSYIYDYAFTAGLGIKWNEVTSLGLNIKRIHRTGGAGVLGVSTLASVTTNSIVDQFSNEGDGYGVDVGWVSRFSHLPFHPTFSAMWKDIGSVQFSKSKGATNPDRLKDNLVIAGTLDGSIPLLGFSAGFEYRHANDQGLQFGQKMHLGVELSLAMVDLRAGFYQGYVSYGLGMDLWLFQLNAASYSVEKGAYPGQSEDARIQVSLDATLSFDPDFNLVGMGAASNKRKLKQRR